MKKIKNLLSCLAFIGFVSGCFNKSKIDMYSIEQEGFKVTLCEGRFAGYVHVVDKASLDSVSSMIYSGDRIEDIRLSPHDGDLDSLAVVRFANPEILKKLIKDAREYGTKSSIMLDD